MIIKRKRHFKAEVSTSSLNDIMFFLLLFFLIVSSLANPNVIKLLLPNSKSAQNLSKQQISISVTKDKRYYIDSREIKFDEIESILKARMSNSGGTNRYPETRIFPYCSGSRRSS